MIQIISSPAALAALATANTEASEPDSTQHIQLNLLEPLADPDVLSQCRNPKPRQIWPGEYIDITPLSKAWRDCWKTFQPASGNMVITFDLSLPTVTSEAGARTLWWDRTIPSECNHMAVLSNQVLLLARTLATVMKMRCQGRARFVVVTGQEDGNDAMRDILKNDFVGIPNRRRRQYHHPQPAE